MQSNTQKSSCKSVFKDGNTISKVQFNNKWIELINILEKNKNLQFLKH